METLIETYQKESTLHWKQLLLTDRQQFIKQLLYTHRIQPANNETRKIARMSWDAYQRLECLETEAHEQHTGEQVTCFKHSLHRRLYTAWETAQIISKEDEETRVFAPFYPICCLEGTFRIV